MAIPRFFGATDGFLPQPTGMAVAFVRDPQKFKCNQYIQLVASQKPKGIYYKLDPDQPIRVVTDEEFVWTDGDVRPSGNANLGNFQVADFTCERRDYPYTIGHQALETADIDIKAFHNAIVLLQAMTNRTQKIIKLLENPASWGMFQGTANSLNGGAGDWTEASSDPTSPNYLAIRKTFNAVRQRVSLATNSLVEPSALRCVLCPETAQAMSETDEINAYLKNNEFGLAQVRGDTPGQNAEWGLPDKLYGMEIIVEDASRVITRPKADGTPATIFDNKVWVKDKRSAIFLSRPGGLQGNYGAPAFSTAQLYYYKYDMVVEAFDDPKNKRYEGHVVDQSQIVIPAPQAGYLVREVMPA